MNEEINKAFVSHFLSGIEKDLNAVDHFFSPTSVAHLPGMAKPTNREGFKAFVSSLYTAFPDLRHTVIEQIAENEKVASLVSARGTHRGVFQGIASTGREVLIMDVIIVHIEGGSISELWAQFDVLSLLQQLGAPCSLLIPPVRPEVLR